MVIASVHNLHEPEHQLNQNLSIENQSCQNEQVKTNMPTVIYNVNQVGTLPRIYGTYNDIRTQPVFMKIKEAQETKKAIKLIARKRVD